MSREHTDSITDWAVRHTLLVWLGIALNLAFAVPLLFSPGWILGALGLPLDQPIWGRFSGLLLLIISTFYVPATIDLARYRAVAWLAILPSRTAGAVFFFVAVFLYDQPPAFLIATLLDGSIAVSTLYCLVKVEALERGAAMAGVAA